MDAEQFREQAKRMVDYIADYMENIQDRRPLADVRPGYLNNLIPDHAPDTPDGWDSIMADLERVIMPGVTHWHSPHFHAYFPTACSYPSILADMISDAIGCIGFTWISSPACTELEVVMMDWLAKMLDLPGCFMSGGKGGGVIQGTASESTLVALLAARSKIMAAHKDEKDFDSRNLVCYTSEQAHSSVERACLLGSVHCRLVPADDANSMRGDALKTCIEEDIRSGRTPFYVVATLGTTSTCSFDNLLEIGPVCVERSLWLHIDAAYAGSAFICPEFRPLLDGVELADSFNFNPHKWLLVNFDCSALWFKDTSYVVNAFNVDPLYLKHDEQQNPYAPDYRHWQIPLGRRFRSLKIWFVLRSYGVTGLQNYIRKHVELAKDFEKLVESDSRFEVTHPVIMGLVCFRLKNEDNAVNEQLLKALNRDGRIHLVPAKSKSLYFLRLAICSAKTQHSDVVYAWNTILDVTEQVLADAHSSSIN